MTFSKFLELLKTKYPNAEAYAHNVMCGDVPHYKGKTGVVFAPGGKVFMYSGAYEDVLNKVGIPTITHERFDPMCEALAKYKAEHGTKDPFFGFTIDCSKDIDRLEAEIAEIRATHFIV